MKKRVLNDNIQNGNEMDVLRENFPSCFRSDGSFDMERFRELLNDNSVITDEGYELKFLGKKYARLLASVSTQTILIPDRENNSAPENAASGNIYISGDNLDGLKHLAGSYGKRIDCIYIDPPYNTGSDGFAYKDRFNFTAGELSEKLRIGSEQAQRILDMSTKGSASHSAYLMYMYPRLILARDLLSDSGAIFISVGDSECCNLKLLCDEIFGEQNFSGMLPRITKKSGKDHSNGIASNHDFILVYLKNADSGALGGIGADMSDYKEKDEYYDERGPYKLNQTLDYNSLWYNPAMDYVLNVDGQDFYAGGSSEKHKERHAGKHNAKDWVWRWSRALFDFGYKNGFVVIKKGKDRPRIYTKTYYNAKIVKNGSEYAIKKIDRHKRLSSLEFTDNRYSNDNATKEIGALMDKNLFDFPKPSSIVRSILKLMPDDVTVMDFFSGSGTTAHAVMQMNAEDGGKRRFILIQLNEPLKENTYGFKSIDELGMARIGFSAEKIRKNYPDTSADLGFRHYTMRGMPADTSKKSKKPPVISDTDTQSILTTWLVRDGYGFFADAVPVDFAGYTGFWIGTHLYLIGGGSTKKTVTAIINKYTDDKQFAPENLVLYGCSFRETDIEDIKNRLSRLKVNDKKADIHFEVRY